MAESSRNRFVRLAIARVNKTIKSIQVVGNLSNKSNYSYTEDDVDRIFRALQNELKTCRQRFSNEKSEEKSSFSLD